MEIKVVEGGSGVDYRDVVERIDLRDLIAPGRPRSGDKPVLVLCFMHGEKENSLAVYKDGLFCFGCHRRMSTLEYIALIEHLDIETQFQDVVAVAGEKYAGNVKVIPRPVEKREIAAVWGPMAPELALVYHGQLGEKRKWFKDRGLSDAVIGDAKLGYTGKAFSIPVWSRSGELMTIRYRRDDALIKEGAKYWGTKGRNSVYLFNEKALEFGPLKASDFVAYLTEGELDALRLWQEGLAAVSATNGVGAFDAAFVPMFRLARAVVVMYDQDEAGRENAARVAKLFKSKAKVVHWDMTEGKDVTEYLKGHDIVDLKRLVEESPKGPVRFWGSQLRGGFWNGGGDQGY
jgi:DNA primase